MPRLLVASLVVLLASLLAVGQQPKPKVDPPKPFDIMDWTPRPPVGKAEPWEKKKDPDWDETRFQSMNTGPTQNATIGREFFVPGASPQQPPKREVEVLAYKGTAVKLGAKGDACVIFDRATMRLAAGWTGGYLQNSVRRFGLLNTPTQPTGAKFVFKTTVAHGWADEAGKFPSAATVTAPLAGVKYGGHYLHEDRVVFSYSANGVGVLDSVKQSDGGFLRTVTAEAGDNPLSLDLGGKVVEFKPGKLSRSQAIQYGTTQGDADDLTALTKPGPKRWGNPLVTKLVKGDESGPFAVDTLTIPYENPFKALFFCTGLDFLPDGRIAVCTCHGDVWLVKVDEAKGECQWQRYATGLYHPLGLKVVDGKVVVLERGQLTRSHDNNDDGEADFYECVSNDWHTGNGEHSYDTCLETDPDGNFYFFKTGDTHLPSGGCLMKVSKDGKKVETFATGFRHPIGMGMSPTGILTGADQEGNWMPATRVDQYKKGGFYGDMRAAHRDPLPKTYDGPLCWLPREVDNSAGGQTWVPASGDSPWAKSPLAGLPLHFSYGRCRPYVLLRQEFKDGTVQGGVAGLPIQFLAGVCRGRFHPKDGQLYVCGLNGWQTAAKADGCLQRVRLTGKPLDAVVRHEVTDTGVTLHFTRPLDKKTAENPANYKAAWWNYIWRAEYGSKRWKVSNPKVEGQDELVIASAKLVDEKTVKLTFAGGMKPVMQLQVGYNVAANDGTPVTGSVFLTVHKTAME